MNWIRGSIANCLFELKRSMTIQRGFVAAVLSLFPPIMVFLLLYISITQNEPGIIGQLTMMLVMLVSLVCVLSILLWATPNVYSELEGKSWIFSASRPNGRTSLLLGKYLAAVIYSFVVCEIAITISLLLTVAFNIPVRDLAGEWISLSSLFFLGCVSYGAVFSLIGTVFSKRSMVIGAVYVVLFEGFCGMLPSLLAKFTMQYHLRSIGFEWLGFFLPRAFDEETYNLNFGEPVVWFNLTCLLAGTILFLFVAILVINWRQYITSDET